MSFIGRRSEQRLLEDEYSRQGSSFVVVSGVRRVGKTALVRRFIEGKDSFYYLAREETLSSNLRRFLNEISERTKKEDQSKDWKTAFSELVPRPKSKLVIVIDDFHLLASADGSILPIIKEAWNKKMGGNNVMFILCGTETGLMNEQALKDYSEIYSCCTVNIQLKPLSFFEISNAFGDLSFKEAVELYTVTGGIPKYVEILEDGELRKSLVKNVLGRNGPLHDEPEFILRSEVRELSYYMSIMESIASGNRLIGDIAKSINVQSKILSPYLGVLEEIGMIERELPFAEKDKKRSRMGQYRIKDGFIEFWFRFVYPFKDSLDAGDDTLAKEELKDHFSESFVSARYDDVCIEIFGNISEKIGMKGVNASRYWNSKSTIGLVAADDKNKVIFAADCYYSKEEVQLSALSDLVKKCSESKDMVGYKVINGLFSRSGFSDELVKEARGSGTVLINKMKVV
ncbi:MAG: ATP-binding protein [Candidatus Methanogranum gryphiswaldense]|nr:MAG: ATP-binding protein [Candidatus Methanogranum sp. U3.2.1]